MSGPERQASRVPTTTNRIVVDVGLLDASLVTTAPGKSEHPHYRDDLSGGSSRHAGLLAGYKVLVREFGAQRLMLELAP